MSIVTLFLLVSTVLADGDVSAPRGVETGKTYSISDIETVSMQSGNVMFNVPLGSLPPSRGGISGGVSLMYNSTLWDGDMIHVGEGQGWPTEYDTFPVFPSLDGGWHYAYKYQFRYERHLYVAGAPIGQYLREVVIVWHRKN